MAAQLHRRDWLKLMGGAAGALMLPACGYYEAERGEAYAPWNYPGGETAPELIAARAALLAANPHNTQAWALRVTSTAIDLHADLTRSTGSIDSLVRELHIGLGCALENLVIAARASGRTPSVTVLPDAVNPTWIAAVALLPNAALSVADPLFAAIAARHTNRGPYSNAPPASSLEPALQALVTEPGVALQLFTSAADLATLRTGTIDATVAFVADAQLSHDSNLWYRHTAEEILTHRDGLTLDATGNGAAIRFLGKSAARPTDASADAYWLASTRGASATGSAMGILSSLASNTRSAQLGVGRVYQRLSLWAQTQGLAVQPLNQLPELQDREETQGLTPTFTRLLEGVMAAPGRRAQMLFRIGVPWDTALASPRRPLEWVLA
jgi:hypothetical protein